MNTRDTVELPNVTDIFAVRTAPIKRVGRRQVQTAAVFGPPLYHGTLMKPLWKTETVTPRNASLHLTVPPLTTGAPVSERVTKSAVEKIFPACATAESSQSASCSLMIAFDCME